MHPGERVAGRFEIVEETARGGMGTVFRARDRKERRDVALKVMSGELLRGPERFAQEAAILAGLRHPNIVGHVAHGATPDGLRYLAMDWIDGETLGQRLDRTGLSLRETVAIGRQLAAALGALHAAGVVHRDLKPSNVMLVDGGARAVLVDFGVARRTTDPGRLTRTGGAVGTAGYMSPEQVRGGVPPIDGRSDLFALGCVLYECLTGARAFLGESALATRAKVLVHDPPPVRVLAPTVPPPLAELVSALLARDPSVRPHDAAEVEAALGALGDVTTAWIATRAAAAIAPTVSSTPTELLHCAVIASWRVDPARAPSVAAALAGAAGLTADTLEGGLIVLRAGAVADAVALALDVAARFPAALLAVGAGTTPEGAIDAGARLVEAIELDPAWPSDAEIAGVWLDRPTAMALGDGFAVRVASGRVKVLGRR